MNLRASLLAVFVLATTSCALGDGSDERAAEATQAIGGGSCQEWMCGTNSPQIANFGFWDLSQPPLDRSAPGTPNVAGVYIAGFAKQFGSVWGSFTPRVVAGRLYAAPYPSNAAPSNVVLSGQNLVGGFFIMMTPSGPYRLWIDEVGSVRSWAQPVVPPGGMIPPPLMLESYRLNWTEWANVEFRHNVCNNAGQFRDEMGMNGKLAFHTLLFEGDRLSAASKRVTGVDTNWFNLGCAGSALAKMALTGHTEAARIAGNFDTTLLERTTMLKMLTADYCGDFGDHKPWTVPGQPLNWADDKGTMKMIALAASPPRQVVREARWAHYGVVCMDKPRVDEHWTQLGEDTFLTGGISVYEQVIASCPRVIPSCAGSALGTDGYHLITASEPLAPPP